MFAIYFSGILFFQKRCGYLYTCWGGGATQGCTGFNKYPLYLQRRKELAKYVTALTLWPMKIKKIIRVLFCYFCYSFYLCVCFVCCCLLVLFCFMLMYALFLFYFLFHLFAFVCCFLTILYSLKFFIYFILGVVSGVRTRPLQFFIVVPTMSTGQRRDSYVVKDD